MHISNAFKYSPFTGNKLKKLDEYLFLDEKENKKHYINSKPTANIIIDINAQILLGKRAVDPKINTWTLPGGFVDPGETLEQAAVRETQEELGISISTDNLEYLNSSPTLYEYQGVTYDVLNSTFICQGTIDINQIKPQDDISEIKFFNYDEIPYNDIGFDFIGESIKKYINSRK